MNMSDVAAAVTKTNSTWRIAGRSTTHRITAVLVAFLGCLHPKGHVTAEDVHDAWNDLATEQCVDRDGLVLEPDGDNWVVLSTAT